MVISINGVFSIPPLTIASKTLSPSMNRHWLGSSYPDLLLQPVKGASTLLPGVDIPGMSLPEVRWVTASSPLYSRPDVVQRLIVEIVFRS